MREAVLSVEPEEHGEAARLLQEQAEMLFEAGRLSEAAEAAEAVMVRRKRLNDPQGESRARDLRDRALSGNGLH